MKKPEPKYRVVAPEDRVLKPDPQKDKYLWFEEQVRELGPGHEFKPEES